MKLLPRTSSATRSCPVFAKLFDHQLAHRVIQIRRIERSAVSLLLGVPFVLQTLLEEELLGFLDRHSFRMKADRGDEPYVPQKCFLKLPEMQVRFACAKPGLVHHLLRVVCIAFRERVADEYL